jgi:hypothetical protein
MPNSHKTLHNQTILILTLFKASSTHRTIFIYCTLNCWKLEWAVETKINVTFRTAIESAANHFSASVTRSR